MSAFPEPWSQSGRLSLWRYTPKVRMYSGWHVSADAEGCDSLLELLGTFASVEAPNHRTLAVVDPKSVGVDRIFGDHTLKVYHHTKLRLAFDSTARETELVETSDCVTLAISAGGLEAFREAFTDLRSDEADFSIGLAGDDRLSFWWWPK